MLRKIAAWAASRAKARAARIVYCKLLDYHEWGPCECEPRGYHGDTDYFGCLRCGVEYGGIKPR
jgi:hypothetical protein